MTSMLAIVLAVLAAAAIYLAAQSGRRASGPGAHLDAGADLPGWVLIFAGSGVLVAGFGISEHLRLVSIYGLQANHLALSLIPAALAAALFQKRLWLASRILARQSPGETFGAYYDSPSIRIIFLGILFLFAVPFATTQLSLVGEILSEASLGSVTRPAALAAVAFALFLLSAIGGWRATVYAVAILSFLLVTMLAFAAIFTLAVFEDVAFLGKAQALAEGIFADQIPGVIQFAGGIGSETPGGGLWTTAAIASWAIAATGVALSPSFGFLNMTVASRKAAAFSQVWVVSGIATGLLLLAVPIIAVQAGASGGFPAFTAALALEDELAAACFTLLLISGSLLLVTFLACSAASIFTVGFIARDLLPGLTQAGARLAARISLAGIYGLMLALAVFLPAAAAAFGALALPLSVQLFPAYLGLCWLPWLSRSAVLSGFILGSLVVLFTEPPGLAVFSALFVQLPWGRWPLTVHSAVWGLAVNLAAALLAAIFTRKGAERDQRGALHAIFARDYPQDFGAGAARGAKWSLVLLWAFLAIGPGAILGNSFFSRPIFLGEDVAIGLPSLLVWQLTFWILGVMLVWWLAYQIRLSVHAADRIPSGELRLGFQC